MPERAGENVTEMARRCVWKFPLALRSGPQAVEMPAGSTIVHTHTQVIGGEPVPVLWADVNATWPPQRRTFHVIATGFDDVPEGATYVGTIHVEWTVWHIYEEARRG